jgi:hypothetical protein
MMTSMSAIRWICAVLSMREGCRRLKPALRDQNKHLDADLKVRTTRTMPHETNSTCTKSCPYEILPEHNPARTQSCLNTILAERNLTRTQSCPNTMLLEHNAARTQSCSTSCSPYRSLPRARLKVGEIASRFREAPQSAMVDSIQEQPSCRPSTNICAACRLPSFF